MSAAPAAAPLARAAWPRWAGPLLLVVGCLLLHAPGLGWGLPSAYGWAPDELLPEQVLAGWRQGFAGGWSSKYPPFHHALLALVYLPVLAWYGVSPAGDPPQHVYHALFLAGRGLSLAQAVGCVWLVERCGRLAAGPRAGFFAAAIAATTLPFGFYARLANLDVPYLFWWLVSLLFLLRALRTARRRDLVACACAAGLSVATKDQAYGLYVLSVPGLVAAHARALRGGTFAARLGRTLCDHDLLVAAGAGVVTWALACNLPLNWSGFVAHLRLIVGPASETFRQFEPTLAGQAALFGQSLVNLAFCLGMPAFAVGLLGLAVAFAGPPAGGGPASRDALLRVTLLPAVSYYATFVAVVLYSYDRFMLPVAVVLALFGGRLLDEASRWPGWQGRLGRVAAALVLAYGVARCVSLGVLLRHDARYAVERWLAAEAPPGARLAGIGPLPLLPRFAHLPRREPLAWGVLPPSTAALAESRPEFAVINADLVRRTRSGSQRADFYGRLQRGELGYRLALRQRYRNPWLVFDSERLLRGAYGPVISNLERVNPEIEVYRRDP